MSLGAANNLPHGLCENSLGPHGKNGSNNFRAFLLLPIFLLFLLIHKNPYVPHLAGIDRDEEHSVDGTTLALLPYEQ